MKTVSQGVYFGLTALLLCPAISLAAEVDYEGESLRMLQTVV